MTADADVARFIESVGAYEPSEESEDYAKWKAVFRRSNYFLWEGTFIIVKISRSKKPFWGVGRQMIELLNTLDNYFLVLLVSDHDGWVFSKSEVNSHISSKRWNLREKDDNYKINPPLPDRNSFFSPGTFKKRTGLNEDGRAT